MRSNAASVNMARFPELSENDLACLLESKKRYFAPPRPIIAYYVDTSLLFSYSIC
jgi:hypothetical protein